MTEIAAALVKELRDQTGAGMMDSKRALLDTNGDIEAAKTLLRERGLASAAKRAGNETTEGKVGYRVADDAKRGVIVAVGSESEPVSNNQEFLSFEPGILSRRHDGADDARKNHGRDYSRLLRGFPDRQDVFEIRMRPRDHMDTDQLTNSASCCRSGIRRCLHRSHVTANKYCDVTGADIFLS